MIQTNNVFNDEKAIKTKHHILPEIEEFLKGQKGFILQLFTVFFS